MAKLKACQGCLVLPKTEIILNKGRVFEDDIADFLDENKIPYRRNERMKGVGKRWEVDFNLHQNGVILFCKNLKENKVFRSSQDQDINVDFLRCLDLMNLHHNLLFCLLLKGEGYKLRAGMVKFATDYGIFILPKKEHILEVINGADVLNLNTQYLRTLKTGVARCLVLKADICKLISEKEYTKKEIKRVLKKKFLDSRLLFEMVKENKIDQIKFGTGNLLHYYKAGQGLNHEYAPIISSFLDKCEFIKENYQSMTDGEIAERLKTSAHEAKSIRKTHLGLLKGVKE